MSALMDQSTATAAPLRVLIADDHGIVRSGLRKLLESEDGIEVVAEAADGLEARDLALSEQPDLAILDVKMPNWAAWRRRGRSTRRPRRSRS